MPDFRQLYLDKLRTPDEIAACVQSGFICATGTCLSEPTALTAAFARQIIARRLTGVVHHQVMSVYPSPFFNHALNGRYNAVSWFSTACARKAAAEDRCDVMPAYYRDIPALIREHLSPDVFYATVSPMDSHGYFSFGTTGAEVSALWDSSRLRFLEVNPNMPRTFGPQLAHVSQADLICEHDAPLSEAAPVKPDPVSRTIASLLAEEIPDGATLQLGIGGIPEAVGAALRGKRELGIHTELFTDSMADLIECGAVTNSRKRTHRFKSVATLAYGSRRLYDFLDDNPGVEFWPVDYVNDPAVIARNEAFFSINACLEVDLWGQAASESIGPRHFSGTGGQVDFVRGAVLSPGGRSYLVTPSTAKGGGVSRITPTLAPGAIVTTSKNDIDCVVTEYGIARLRGRTYRQRAQALIAIAHPDHRNRLRYEARQMHLI